MLQGFKLDNSFNIFDNWESSMAIKETKCPLKICFGNKEIIIRFVLNDSKLQIMMLI